MNVKRRFFIVVFALISFVAISRLHGEVAVVSNVPTSSTNVEPTSRGDPPLEHSSSNNVIDRQQDGSTMPPKQRIVSGIGSGGRCQLCDADSTVSSFCAVASTAGLPQCNLSYIKEQSKWIATHPAQDSEVEAQMKRIDSRVEAYRAGGDDGNLDSTILEFLEKDACRGGKHRNVDFWTAGTWLRQSGHVRAAMDCQPPSSPPLACVPNMSNIERHSKTIASRIQDGSYKMLDYGHLPGAVSRPLKKTEYTRKGRAAWVSMKNVCMTCENKGDFFMNPNRRCHTTLWSVDEVVNAIGPKNRKGRHSIFFEREGAYQYGGAMSKEELQRRGAKWLSGTTIFNAAMSIDNVGHMLHDGHWAFNALLLVRQDAEFPTPHRVMLDEDYYDNTGAFLAYLNNVMAEYEMKDMQVVNPVSAKNVAHGERVLCFENFAVSGGDRAGNSAGYKSGRRWAVAGNLRAAVLHQAFGISRTITEGKTVRPRIFVYGRTDVYRRSVDNFGALVAIVQDVAAALRLDPPRVIPTFNLSPSAQIAMSAQIDVLISVQGAHLQHSLFMPKDAVVYEICPCFAKRTSFIARYGMFLPLQKHYQTQLCKPMINFSGNKYGQNLTLCPQHLVSLKNEIEIAVSRLIEARRKQHP